MDSHDAYRGAQVADALAMPVHWYYDRAALRRDYGKVDHYMVPKKEHPGSILWRSEYRPLNEKGDILHDQAKYWGRPGVHYHQFLRAGENTANLKLADLLYRQVTAVGGYDANRWLDSYIEAMLTPGWHGDTYLEEYHRAFFFHYAKGKDPRKCGVPDQHIGGLAQVPALFSALVESVPLDELRRIVQEHVSLTHQHGGVLSAANCLVCLLKSLSEGENLRAAMKTLAGDWFSASKAEKWLELPDLVVVGERLSTACYIDQSFPASLYLAWKYHDDFDEGIVANTMVGGDNCHRGVVVGALLGLANGVPGHWKKSLDAAPQTHSS